MNEDKCAICDKLKPNDVNKFDPLCVICRKAYEIIEGGDNNC